MQRVGRFFVAEEGAGAMREGDAENTQHRGRGEMIEVSRDARGRITVLWHSAVAETALHSQ